MNWYMCLVNWYVTALSKIYVVQCAGGPLPQSPVVLTPQWHRRMGLSWLICNGKTHWTGLVTSQMAVLTSLWCHCHLQGRWLHLLLLWPIQPIFVFCIKLGLNHLDLFLLVLFPLLLNWKTEALLNIFHRSFLCHCWYLKKWFVKLTSLRWSKSGTLTVSVSWMNTAGVSCDKFLGSSAFKSNLKSWSQACHCKELPSAFHTWEKLFQRWFSTASSP